MDTLPACLDKKPSLVDTFLNNLLEVPAIQEKITEKVLGSIEPNIPASESGGATAQSGCLSGSTD